MSLATNLIFTIWAVSGGFILHFLLSNYLTVLLKPSYEKPVETTADLIERNLIPYNLPGGEIWIQIFAASSDPNYQEISWRMVIAKDWKEFNNMIRMVTSTGLYAEIGTYPDSDVVPEEKYSEWYRSKETVPGLFPYVGHLANKKWPLKKVLISCTIN